MQARFLRTQERNLREVPSTSLSKRGRKREKKSRHVIVKLSCLIQKADLTSMASAARLYFYYLGLRREKKRKGKRSELLFLPVNTILPPPASLPKGKRRGGKEKLTVDRAGMLHQKIAMLVADRAASATGKKKGGCSHSHSHLPQKKKRREGPTLFNIVGREKRREKREKEEGGGGGPMQNSNG